MSVNAVPVPIVLDKQEALEALCGHSASIDGEHGTVRGRSPFFSCGRKSLSAWTFSLIRASFFSLGLGVQGATVQARRIGRTGGAGLAVRGFFEAYPALREAAAFLHVPPGRVGAKIMRLDLKAAGIDYVDESGKVADFHSLRHTFITSLANAGIHPSVAQALARHSTITLTMDRAIRIRSWRRRRRRWKRCPTCHSLRRRRRRLHNRDGRSDSAWPRAWPKGFHEGRFIPTDPDDGERNPHTSWRAETPHEHGGIRGKRQKNWWASRDSDPDLPDGRRDFKSLASAVPPLARGSKGAGVQRLLFLPARERWCKRLRYQGARKR